MISHEIICVRPGPHNCRGLFEGEDLVLNLG